MSYSDWMKTDLHIHSDFSSKTKHNDYDGEKLTFDDLKDSLKKEKVNFFSITDHNNINIPLYKELLAKRDELESNNLNFLIGSEIDFKDSRICDTIFHMLVYFNSKDLEQITKVFTNVYKKDNMDELGFDLPPVQLNDFFDAVFNNGIQEIITIPHFHDKHKSIPANNKQLDKFVYTVFNALEDKNNRNNLIKSIKVFEESNISEIPLVIFSDNHNIKDYPKGKNGNPSKCTSMHILGNIKFPFESVKLAFQDVNMRVSIDDVSMRKINGQSKYIKAISVDNEIIPLSKYQNTIIGGFGTGKSFLLNLLLNGKDNVSSNYKELSEKYSNFHFIFYDDTTKESLAELQDDIKIIKFEQYKEIYFKDFLIEHEKKKLEQNLDVEFPSLEILEKKDESNIVTRVNDLIENYKNLNTISNSINYEICKNRKDKSFTFTVEKLDSIFSKPEYYESLILDLQIEKEQTVLGLEIYSEEGKTQISESKEIIENTNIKYSEISDKIDNILKKISEKMVVHNAKISSQNSKLDSTLRNIDQIKNDLISYNKLLYEVKEASKEFENTYSEENFNKIKAIKKEIEFSEYKFIAQYSLNGEYPYFINELFKRDYRKETLFKSILLTINSEGSFSNNKSFEDRINQYLDNYFINFQTIYYDIYQDETSIMKKSAGEKANSIINIIFKNIEKNSESGISSLVILDQPEDNMDNKGITSEIVNRIRRMKKENYMPQFLCVTHNANISISADSENIILANKENGKCIYTSSGLEDSNFVDRICKVIEGGKDALKKRGIKFNIPIIKEFETGAKNE